jgi:hypothetical protein
VALPELRGLWRYTLRIVGALVWLSLVVTYERLYRGPSLLDWTWSFEVGMRFLRHQTRVAFDLRDIVSHRAYVDALVLQSAPPADVSSESVREPVRGKWYSPAHRTNQAGGAEILADMFHAIVQRAREQGCEISLDVWEHMTHDFQAYGPAFAQSAEAFERLRAVLHARLPGQPAS